MTLDRLYTAVTCDIAPRGQVARELARLPRRRRRAVELRVQGRTWSEIGDQLHITPGAAWSSAARALRSIWKRLLELPRYHNLGHPPPRVRKSRHARKAKTDRSPRRRA